MNDDLLVELGKMARKEEDADKDRLDERWDRLAAGTLTADEEAELKALAATSPEAREAYEAFRPLGADFQARVVSAIQAERAAEAPRVLPFRRPFRQVVRRAEVWVGLAAAVAAGVFFLVGRPEPISSGLVAHLDGGFKPNRGGESVAIYAPGSPFLLDADLRRPLEHPEKLEARAFLSSSAGREDWQTLGLEKSFEAAASGSVRLNATMGKEIKVPPGHWIVWTVVARKRLPEAGEVQERLRARRPRNASWQALCEALQQEEKPPPAPWQVACVDFHAEGQPAP